MRVALATCRVLPEPDPDQEPLLAALRAAGMEAELLAWDDPDADLSRFDLCVLRSTWNYPQDPEAFLAWVDRASQQTRLLNPPSLVRWNLHKRYLAELDRQGIPVVPTAFVDRGDATTASTIARERGWNEIVIKPAISASSYRTKRFPAGQLGEADAFLTELTHERDALVQEYLPSFEDPGERAVVRIAGETTHLVGKSPRFSGEDESVSDSQQPSDEERALVGRILAQLGSKIGPRDLEEEPLYARVDLVLNRRGRVCVSELELIEPSLFLVHSPRAMDLFVQAIQKRARGT
jgi:hypothetical protein